MRWAIVLLWFPSVSLADGFEPINSREQFVSFVDGRELRISWLGLSLNVDADGSISGKAMRWPVTGNWTWNDGYFCREMDWSGRPIEFNCQLVEVRNERELRFTVDRGAGESATLQIR